ncbi:polyketide cyclase [Mycolicibacterium sp. XJ1819]
MTEQHLHATTIVNAPIETVFEVLADPSTHQLIDGTGWVREPLDGEPLTEVGQVFRMAMYHDNHPEKHYEMANLLEVFDQPHAIAWQPGQGPEQRGYLMNGTELQWGGWIWRYDLEASGPEQTAVTLTYDWSNVVPHMRDIEFPPFEPQHLDNSLKNLASIAESR